MAKHPAPTITGTIPTAAMGQRVVQIVENGKPLKFYSATEAAARIGINISSVVRMMNRGDVRVIISVDGVQRMLLEEDVLAIAAARALKK
jgi:hypothetical protein